MGQAVTAEQAMRLSPIHLTTLQQLVCQELCVPTDKAAH